MRTDASKLASIHGFTKAGVGVGRVRAEDAHREFEETGHSCYNEGWAAGFQHAFKLAEEFVRDTLAEQESAEGNG